MSLRLPVSGWQYRGAAQSIPKRPFPRPLRASTQLEARDKERKERSLALMEIVKNSGMCRLPSIVHFQKLQRNDFSCCNIDLHANSSCLFFFVAFIWRFYV